MRRFFLLLIVICFAGWSQPAQPQTQPPIVVQIQTPPANPVMRLIELVIPGIIGALLALFGVWLTNRTNARTSETNRLHDLEKVDRQHTFELKRDVLMRLTQAQGQTLAALIRWYNANQLLERLQVNGEDVSGGLKQAEVETAATFAEYRLRGNELSQATASSSLALSDELWHSAKDFVESIRELYGQIIERNLPSITTLQRVANEMTRFTEAARKELGLVQIAAKQRPSTSQA
jgi:hypothetical protein